MVKTKQKNDKNGFTLVEALATISITLILITMILSGLSQAKQRFLVRDTAQQLAAYVRQTIADTRNGVKVDGCTPFPFVGSRGCSSYAINANSTFRNRKELTKSVLGFTPPNTSIQGFKVPKGVTFQGVGVGVPPSTASLSFTYSTDSFPLVNVTSSNNNFNQDSGTGTITIRVVSESNPNIISHVCIYTSNLVVVRSGACD